MTFKIWADLSCNYWLCKQSQRKNWPSISNGAFTWGISVDAWQRAYLKRGADVTINHSNNNQSHYFSSVAWTQLASVCTKVFTDLISLSKGNLIGWWLRWNLKSWHFFNFCHKQLQGLNRSTTQFCNAWWHLFKINEKHEF